LLGWERYRNHPEKRIRERFAWQAKGMATVRAGGLWAGRHWFRKDPVVSEKLGATLDEVFRSFGIGSRLLAPALGRLVLLALRREDRRLRRGLTYEPPTCYEQNERARAIRISSAEPIASVGPEARRARPASDPLLPLAAAALSEIDR
jgi:hypothetical protein